MRVIYIFPILSITGCASLPESSDFIPPAQRCMVAPLNPPRLKEGDDLVPAYQGLARSYRRETSKLRCTQKWIQTVLNKGG